MHPIHLRRSQRRRQRMRRRLQRRRQRMRTAWRSRRTPRGRWGWEARSNRLGRRWLSTRRRRRSVKLNIVDPWVWATCFHSHNCFSWLLVSCTWNKWKHMSTNENQWKPNTIDENQWKPMKTNANHIQHQTLQINITINLVSLTNYFGKERRDNICFGLLRAGAHIGLQWLRRPAAMWFWWGTMSCSSGLGVEQYYKA